MLFAKPLQSSVRENVMDINLVCDQDRLKVHAQTRTQHAYEFSRACVPNNFAQGWFRRSRSWMLNVRFQTILGATTSAHCVPSLCNWKIDRSDRIGVHDLRIGLNNLQSCTLNVQCRWLFPPGIYCVIKYESFCSKPIWLCFN